MRDPSSRIASNHLMIKSERIYPEPMSSAQHTCWYYDEGKLCTFTNIYNRTGTGQESQLCRSNIIKGCIWLAIPVPRVPSWNAQA